VIDQGWDLLSFAGQASALTSGNVEFDTLPVKGYGKIDGLDFDVIDIPQVQAVVHTLFMPPRSASPAPTAATTTAEHPGVDVHNGHPQWFGPDGAGGKLAGALTARGFARGQTATIGAQDSSQASTARVPGATPGNPAGLPGGLPTSASPVAPAGHVVVYTGHGFTMPGSVQGGSTTAQRPATTVVPTEGHQGGAVNRGGIPCVDRRAPAFPGRVEGLRHLHPDDDGVDVLCHRSSDLLRQARLVAIVTAIGWIFRPTGERAGADAGGGGSLPVALTASERPSTRASRPTGSTVAVRAPSPVQVLPARRAGAAPSTRRSRRSARLRGSTPLPRRGRSEDLRRRSCTGSALHQPSHLPTRAHHAPR
jgi:hypothetical protein